MSDKNIPVNERLIFALDVQDCDQARALVDKLGDHVQFYKLGLELFVNEGYHDLVRDLKKRGKKLFIDMKFYDVPRTVGKAVQAMQSLGADFVTVQGNEDILREAAAHKGKTKVLAVTALTSLDQKDVADMFPDTVKPDQDVVQKLVLSRAKRAIEVGCDGVISSGLEAEPLRSAYGKTFIIITPGIRPFENTQDDQKRVVNVEQAFANGADYIVVGRPIRNADDPAKAAENIQKQIAAIFD